MRDNQVYTRSNDVANPAVHLIVSSNKSGKAVNVWLPPLEGFAENAQSPYQFEVEDLKLGYFTGLEVSHEPGQWAVWTGVVLMGIGLTFVFYIAHTRFWAVLFVTRRASWLMGGRNREPEPRCLRGAFPRADRKIETDIKVATGNRRPSRVAAIAGR